jgi:hypothetical protein
MRQGDPLLHVGKAETLKNVKKRKGEGEQNNREKHGIARNSERENRKEVLAFVYDNSVLRPHSKAPGKRSILDATRRFWAL